MAEVRRVTRVSICTLLFSGYVYVHFWFSDNVYDLYASVSLFDFESMARLWCRDQLFLSFCRKEFVLIRVVYFWRLSTLPLDVVSRFVYVKYFLK